jgi:hypothetical protein
LSAKDPQERVAFMSGLIMGDECVESYYLCGQCGVYTVEVYWDLFSGGEEVSTRGPVSKEVGDAKVALIRQCPEPWEKYCRCKAHRIYWNEPPD